MSPFFHLLFIAISLAQLQTITSAPGSSNRGGNIKLPCSKDELYKLTKPILKGYEYFPGVGFYKFYPKGTNHFTEAQQVCESEGAHLAILNSEAEAKVLHSIYSKHPGAYGAAFIGFHDQASEGKYVTIFGEPLSKTGYTKWRPGEPNQNGGNEDCGSFDAKGGLNDIPCKVLWVKIPFFCEYENF